MQISGRFPRLILELTLGSAACFALALLAPLSFWRALGDTGAAVFILGMAATVAAVAISRGVRNFGPSKLPRSNAFEALD